MGDNYVIRPMSAADIDDAVAWAAAEGWNPGDRDAQCFASVDPAGFIGGFLDGRMIASISVVNYDDAFSFLGFYIVQPEYRGKGYGYRLWQEGMAHAGGRTVGLDGVVAEQENYRRSGFALAYRNIRYGGTPVLPTALPGLEIRALKAPDEVLKVFDRTVFPAPRDMFLEAWLGTPRHAAFAAYRDEALAGYAVARPCVAGAKIGPLFAADEEVAGALATAAIGAVDADEIFLDVPEPNAAAISLAARMGLAPVFETARMYRGAAPVIDLARIYGVTSFELG
ncbi:GNAT family N-acetyltransferase [Nisaea acidiphila]|uniref:GNAT family N-acetyltransferase n=1 Tax=Nisaea acidiphila TaxID=1862145 RepID=A0A9J7ANI7_9PROT|nr:GNAT family N-acetyltransferase [Nisaea acidiphila]UUX48992.1 GNAT family N-acetyltransferase [Nisaea acidiphila]